MTSTTCHPGKYHPFFASYHLEHDNAPRIVKDAVKAADRVEQSEAETGVPTVVLFLTDAKYEVPFPEMVQTWSHFAGKGSLVMLALSNATDVHFRAQGIQTIRGVPEEVDPEQTMREAVLQAKVVVPYVFLVKGMRVVMVEMDIYCRSSPLRFDNGTAEILVTEHDNTREVNFAFWIAYPTCLVIDAFRKMQVWVTDPAREDAYCDAAFDQKLMHFAWLGDGPVAAGSNTACQSFARRLRIFDPAVNKPLALQRISFEHVMHWTNPADRDAWPSNPNTTCVHLWSAFGNPTRPPRHATATATVGSRQSPRTRPGRQWRALTLKGRARE